MYTKLKGDTYSQIGVLSWIPLNDFSEGLAPIWAYFVAYRIDTSESTIDRISKLCFINTTGRVAFMSEHDYDVDDMRFSEGLTFVRSNNRFGYIDNTGKEVIPCQFEEARSFTEGLAGVKKYGKWGYIDKEGNTVIPFIYDSIMDFSEGLASASKNGWTGFIDKAGNTVVPFEYDGSMEFSEGLAWVSKDGLCGLIKNPLDDMIKLMLNGKPVVFDQLPVIENGRVLVPMRAIFEALGSEISWDDTTKSVTAIRGSDKIVMTIGSNIMLINGVELTLDVAPVIIDGRTFVPARAVAESFNASVTWDASTKTVVILDKER